MTAVTSLQIMLFGVCFYISRIQPSHLSLVRFLITYRGSPCYGLGYFLAIALSEIFNMF